MTVTKRCLIATAALSALLLGSVGFAAEDEARVVDGNMWLASSQPVKRAYIVGVVDTLVVQRAIREKNGLEGSEWVTLLTEKLDAMTVDGAIARIDAWFEANPSRRDAPVLGVVWLSLVKAKADAEAR
jgi:hypothetical protein